MTSLYAFASCRRSLAAMQTFAPVEGVLFPKVVSLFLFLVLALTPAVAQQFATLRLTVVDPQGSAITLAKVSVRNVDTGVVRNVTSDQSGVVSIPGLPAGQYTLAVDADAFAPYQAPLVLALGQVADLQVPLRIRTNTEQLEVHDTIQSVDQERSEGSQVINPKQISDLPIADRDFIDFALLTPTATIGREPVPLLNRPFRRRC